MRTYFTHIAIILLTVTMVAGCDPLQEVSPNLSENNDFMLNLTVNGDSLALKAGENGYYMVTDYELNSSNVFVLSGSLEDPTCSNCPKMSITLRDEVTANTRSYLENAPYIKSGAVDFKNNAISNFTKVQFNLIRIDQKEVGNITWTLGDDTETSGIELSTLIHSFGEDSLTNIKNTSTVDYPKFQFSTNLTKDFNFDIQSFATDFYYEFNSLEYEFQSLVYQQSEPFFPVSYLWDFGDGKTSTDKEPIHEYNEKGTYRVCLESTNLETGQKASNCRFIKAGAPDSSGTSHDVVMEVLSNSTLRNLALGQVEISWLDLNGELYQSNLGEQKENQKMTITRVQPFAENENGQQTLKIYLSGNCTLYNSAGDEINLVLSSATLAVAMPGT
jgi:PKD repeat protein